MPVLQVQDISTDLYEIIVQTAQRENRSISQYIQHLLEHALCVKVTENRLRRKNTLQKIDKLGLRNTGSFPDPEVFTREDRDRDCSIGQ